MSMFNDILWKTDDETCISNAEKVKNYANKFLPGHWTFQGPGSEKKWYCDPHDQQGQWDRTANKMVQRFKEIGRGIFKRKRGRTTTPFNGDSMHTELLFQTVHSVNQISVHAAITGWCHQFGLTNEEKERVAIPVDNGILTIVEPEEVDMLVSLPNLALGNKMQGGASFQILEKRVQMRQSCEKAFFQHLVTAGNCYKIRPDDDDGCGKLLLCVENIRVLELIRKLELWQLFTQVQFVTPVIEVRMKKILDELWKRSCDSINLKTKGHIVCCDIQRN